MNKNKRDGFTLVELLAVVVILAIILAIAVPSISHVIKSSTMSSFESDAKMVLKAIDYKKLENENFDETSINKDNISTLLGISGENYSSISIILDNGERLINIVGVGKWNNFKACGTFKSIKVVDASSQCIADKIPPVITLLGDSTININIGDTYVDPGVTAIDNVDGDITSKVVASNMADPNASGTYVITYNVSDEGGNTAIPVTRTVIVNHLDAIEILIVAGGGGGGGAAYDGWNAGGGGAGGVIYNANYALSETSYTVTVGAGGAKGICSTSNSGTTTTQGANGGNSLFGSLTAIGGGGGGAAKGYTNTYGDKNKGLSGGSGGGAANGGSGYTTGGTGTNGQGYNGGNGSTGGSGWAAGGGGAGGAGTSNIASGGGGSGVSKSITGTAVTYAKGGGTGMTAPGNAADNTGNGGDSALNPTSVSASGNGGSGVVIIRYAGSQKADGGTVSSVDGYTIHKFTSGTSTFTLR